MTFSKEWIIFICVVSVVSSVLSALIAKSPQSTLYNYLTAVILIYSILLPVIDAKGQIPELSSLFDYESSDADDFESKSDQSVVSAAQSGAEKAIKDALKEKNIDADVSVQCTIDEDKITIDKVTVSGVSEEKTRQCAEIIGEITQDESEIIFLEEAENR